MSGIVVDFGSHTTRAGYAGEDSPRVVCPSFYGYSAEPSSTSNGDVPMDGTSASGRKLFVGDDGVGVWRGDMEVGNFMMDGVRMFCPREVEVPVDVGEDSDGSGAGCCAAASYPTRAVISGPERAPVDVDRAGVEHCQGEGVFGGDDVRRREGAGDVPWLSRSLVSVSQPARSLETLRTLNFCRFAAGKPTALVLYVGYANSSTVPVVDGYALRAGAPASGYPLAYT